jgi:tetratricopeptide (TPR) repeat protein
MSEAAAGNLTISGSNLSNSNVAAFNHVEGDLIQTTIINTYLSQPPEVDPLPAALERFAALPLAVPADRAPLPPQSRMPISPLAQFVGRDGDLGRLAALVSGGPAPVAITGLGGVGKTALAAEFVHRYGAYFAGGVFWINCADPAAVAAEVALCGGSDCLALFSAADNLPLDEQVKRVQGRWKEPLPRLLVFDGADEATLRAWRPTSGGARVLLTSRDTSWSPTSEVVEVALDVLGPAESVTLLRAVVPQLAEADAAAIAEELGRLPLALRLAADFLAAYPGITAAAYLGQLRAPGLLAHPSLTGRGTDWLPTGHERDVGRTFALSYDALDATAPIDLLARAALARAACLAPGAPIPRRLLLNALPAGAGELDAEDALRRLGDVGLVDSAPDGSLVINRLVARFVQGAGQDEAARPAAEQAMAAIAAELNDSGVPGAMLPFQPHLRALVAGALGRRDALAAALAHELGNHLRIMGDMAAARQLYEQALAIREQALGPDHVDTLESRNRLASILSVQGDQPGARALLEQVVSGAKRTFGPEDLEVATALSNLAAIVQMQGDNAAARSLYEESLAISQKTLAPDAPQILSTQYNLSWLIALEGDPATARSMVERALAQWQASLGADHQNTLVARRRLGTIMIMQGDLPAAQAALESLLADCTRVLGPEHPDTAEVMHDLALVLHRNGDLVAARPLYEQALAIEERACGPEAPTTLKTLRNLGEMLVGQGEGAAAQPLLERALAARERQLGPEHANTVATREQLAIALLIQGQFAAAQPLCERVLANYEQTLGPDHDHTASVRYQLAATLAGQGLYAAAQPLYQHMLKYMEGRFGPDDPNTQQVRAELAELAAQARTGAAA